MGFVGLRMICWVLGQKNTALHGKSSTKGIGGYPVKTRVLPKFLALWRFFLYVPIKSFSPELFYCTRINDAHAVKPFKIFTYELRDRENLAGAKSAI